MKRRKFVQQSTLTLAGMAVFGSTAGQFNKMINPNHADKDLKISLAQWSLHRTINKGEMTNMDFARVTRNLYDIDAIEYVSRFFDGKETDKAYLDALNKEAYKHRVKQLLIMVDGEGGLAEIDDKVRQTSIDNHKKWVEAAKYLGCHSIRVNAHGEGTAHEMHDAAVDGLGRLSEFAEGYGINVIVENHGGLSSDGAWLSGVMKAVGRDNCGTLPDFGNFYEYDRYQGVEDLMPYAKAVSAKSYDFDAEGNEKKIDYNRMLKIVRQAGYTGYVGIEYEGSELPEHEGILATKKLLDRLI